MARIEDLQRQIEAIKARENQLKERLREEQRQHQQRKIKAVGAAVLGELEREPDSSFSRQLWRLIDAVTTAKQDRDILGLSPLPEQVSKADKTPLSNIHSDF